MDETVSCGPPGGPLTTESGKAHPVAAEKWNCLSWQQSSSAVLAFPRLSYWTARTIGFVAPAGSRYHFTCVGFPRVSKEQP